MVLSAAGRSKILYQDFAVYQGGLFGNDSGQGVYDKKT